MSYYNDGEVKFIPERAYPKYVDYDCGCTIEREGTHGTLYYISDFCEEHDPTIEHDV